MTGMNWKTEDGFSGLCPVQIIVYMVNRKYLRLVNWYLYNVLGWLGPWNLFSSMLKLWCSSKKKRIVYKWQSENRAWIQIHAPGGDSCLAILASHIMVELMAFLTSITPLFYWKEEENKGISLPGWSNFCSTHCHGNYCDVIGAAMFCQALKTEIPSRP